MAFHRIFRSRLNFIPLQSVTVEWFERGETKGKEIELEQILDLNQVIRDSNVILYYNFYLLSVNFNKAIENLNT